METPNYILRMREALSQIMKSKGMKPTTLSQCVGPSKTLVAEILKKNNDIKLSTVARLAEELDVSVGEVLGIQSAQTDALSDDPLVSAETLEPILARCLRFAPPDGWTESDARLLARSVEHGLRLLPSDPATQPSGDALAVAGHAASLRLRELRNEE